MEESRLQSSQALKVIDLFSGIGGFALGLEWAGGFETIRFCENDDFCCDVLTKNFPGVPITRDIHDFRASYREADVVVGGFPCQPFSHAGRRQPESDPRNLWPEMRRVVDECSPDWVLCENVTGLVSMGLDRVLFDLEDSGYYAQTLAIPAHAVGAPHRRERIWIIAARMPVSYPSSDTVRHKWKRYWEQRVFSRSAFARNDGEERAVADSGCERSSEPAEEAHAVERARAPRKESVSGSAPVDHADGCRQSIERQPEHTTIESSQGRESDRSGTRRRGPRPRQVADAYRARLEGRSEYRACACQRASWACSRAHEDERLTRSGIRRVSHGIPRRVDRLRALGNAVVPQIVEEIGRAIREATQDEAED